MGGRGLCEREGGDYVSGREEGVSEREGVVSGREGIM